MKKKRQYEKRIHTRSGKTLIAVKQDIKFRQTKYYKKTVSRRARLSEIFDKQVAPQITRFARNKQKGTRREFIFRIETRKNFKGKRITSGYSSHRVKLSKSTIKLYLREFKEEFLKDMERYLKRKDMNSISISGMTLEVTKDVRKTKSARRPKRKTKRK